MARSNLIFEKFSVVVPAYNESARFGKVIDEILKVKEVGELILVDDGSTDDTEKAAEAYKSFPQFNYVKHKKNKGKGAALRTGVKKAKNEVILFLDADLENISANKIRKIALPVLTDEVDVSRGKFRRKRGRVTEYAVKPMMKILFPDKYFEQPITGQICAKKSFLKEIDLESSYGVDIGILFDAIEMGQRIVEVDIGELKHKANTEENIAEMSRQVLETMIKKAGLIQHNYKMVVFTLDKTLIKKDSLELIFDKLGLKNDIDYLIKQLNDGMITFNDFLTESARFLKGIDSARVQSICQNACLAKYSTEVIKALKKRKYKVAIISSNFYPIVSPIAEKLGVDLVECPYLDSKDNKISGKMTRKSMERWGTESLSRSFEKAVNRLINKAQVKASEVIVVANSEKCEPLFDKMGLSIAYRPTSKALKEKSSKTINILPEILAIIE